MNMHNVIHKKTLLVALMASALLLLPTLPTPSHAMERAPEHAQGQVMDSGRPEYVPGEILVKFRQGAGERVRMASHLKKNGKRIRKFRRSDIEHIKLPEGMSVADAVSLYMADPMVEYAGPNRLRYATAFPDDTLYTSQWSLNSASDADIDAPEAWDKTTGDNTIVIAVVDTGVDITHPDLAANIWMNPEELGQCFDGVDGDGTNGNGYVDDCWGWDFVDNDNTPFDYAAHGTMVAGIIGAITNNATGVAGVMWDVKIMPLRFLDSTGAGPVSDEIAAIEYAIDNGAIVLNASFGSYGVDTLERSAISDYCLSGGIFVAAAGNDSLNNDFYPHYPSSYDLSCVISVAASSQSDDFSWFSNYGTNSVHLAAPGSDIYSTRSISAELYSDYFDTFGGWMSDGGPDDNWGVDASGCLYAGDNCLQDSPGGLFAGGLDTWARTKTAISLTGQSNCDLTYLTRYSMGTDNFLAEASSDASTWSILANSTGTTGVTFERMEHDVSTYDGGDLYVRFRLITSGVSDGAYVENMRVRCDGPGSRYTSADGTSFAAPIVSGIAGLVIANAPSMSSSRVKKHVVNSAEVLSTLEGWLITGGRANAANALLPIPWDASATLSGDNSASISWTNTIGGDGYIIEHMGPWDYTFATIAQPGPDSTSYTGNDLGIGTNSYRVRSSSGPNYSGYQKTLSVTIPGDGDGGGGGGFPCFIATAAWGRPDAPEVAALRQLRDEVLVKSAAGQQLIALYNRVSPQAARYIAARPALRAAVRSVLAPAVYLGIMHPERGLAMILAGMIITIGISGGIRRRRRIFK